MQHKHNHWRRHAWSNRLQTFLLLTLMGGFLALLGWILWGVDGLFALWVAGVLLLFLRPLVSPAWVMRLYGGYPLRPEQAPQLYQILVSLTERAGLTMVPVLYYLPGGAVNAFTVGEQRQSAIALSQGLLQSLELDEVVGVLAHELSHVQSNDMRVMALADQIGRMTSLLSLFGLVLLFINLPLLLLGEATINWWAILLLILAPYLSALAQLGLSRTREYDADLNAARLSGDPAGLARALLRIEQLQGGWLERMMFPARRMPIPAMLRTHPPIAERVRRLLALQTEGEAPWPPLVRRRPAPLPGGRLDPGRWPLGRWWY